MKLKSAALMLTRSLASVTPPSGERDISEAFGIFETTEDRRE